MSMKNCTFSSAAQADWNDKMRGKAKPAEPMDVMKAAEEAHNTLCGEARSPDAWIDGLAEYFCRIEQAARQAERRKVLEEVAQWHAGWAVSFSGSEKEPGSVTEQVRRSHVVARDHFRFLAEEVT